MPTIQESKDQLVAHFQKKPSPLVTGIGIGLQPIRLLQEEQPLKAEAGGPWILVFVEPVQDCELQPVWDQVQANAQGAPFLLLRTGRFVGLQATSGSSIGPYVPSRYNVPPAAAGTLGAFVAAQGKQYALSSNHTIAYNGRVPVGAPVTSPGTLDDPYGRTVVGGLSHFVELKPAIWPFNGTPENNVDCALAEITAPGAIVAGQTVQVASGSVSAVTPVKKNGRTTGPSQSAICIWSLSSTPIDLSFGTYCFGDLVGTLGVYQQGVLKPDPFASPGDSGALVLTDPGNEAIGLVMARAYSSGPFTPSPPAAFALPPGGAFVGYIVALCRLDSVRDALAGLLGVASKKLVFSE